ncbi:MAG: hypothetical protein ACRC0G_07125 [Fusobacteriaceae bacterium]
MKYFIKLKFDNEQEIYFKGFDHKALFLGEAEYGTVYMEYKKDAVDLCNVVVGIIRQKDMRSCNSVAVKYLEKGIELTEYTRMIIKGGTVK